MDTQASTLLEGSCNMKKRQRETKTNKLKGIWHKQTLPMQTAAGKTTSKNISSEMKAHC